MKKTDLEKLRGMKAEIKSLSLQAEDPEPTMEIIFYKDYRTGKGIPKYDVGSDFGAKKRIELEKRMRKLAQERLKMIEALEDELEQVEDPMMRTILRYYYRDGKTQEEIGDLLGYSREAIAKKITRFWQVYQNYQKK